jgi:hypothetical protein
MRVKKRLSGFLLEDICTFCGFAGIPKELFAHMGLAQMDRCKYTAVLDRAEAKRAMAYCFYLLGVGVLESSGKVTSMPQGGRPQP